MPADDVVCVRTLDTPPNFPILHTRKLSDSRMASAKEGVMPFMLCRMGSHCSGNMSDEEPDGSEVKMAEEGVLRLAAVIESKMLLESSEAIRFTRSATF